MRKSIRDLTILGRNATTTAKTNSFKINGSKDNSSYMINRINTVLEVEDMGSWIPEPSRRFNLLFTVEGSGIQGNGWEEFC
jgi:hypothetical protein